MQMRRRDVDFLPEIDPRRRVNGVFVDPQILRVRVILRAGCGYMGDSLGQLEQQYQTPKEWDDRADYAHQSKRLWRAARGLLPRGDAAFFDGITGEERPLWEALARHHPGLTRFVVPWIYSTVDPTVAMDWTVAQALMHQWPRPLLLRCLERVRDYPESQILRAASVKDETVRRFAEMTQIEGPFAALLLTRLMHKTGAEANFFRLRALVSQAIESNREVGEAFGSDIPDLMRLVTACLTLEPVPPFHRHQTGRRTKQAPCEVG